MKLKLKSITLVLSTVLMLTACNFPLFNQGPSAEELLATTVAQTVQALNQQVVTQPAQQPTNTLPSLPTITPAATATSLLPQPATATPVPCNKAQFVSETIPDNTVYNAGETFTKTWRFKNIGTCTWNTNYKLVFASGDAMGGAASTNLSANVAPGQAVDVSVNLTAPASGGTYKGNWKLQAEDGEQYAGFWVQIKVQSAAFAVTSVTTNLVDVSPGVCPPYTYNIEIYIAASAPGNVTYYTETSLGATSATKTVTFASAGTKTETTTWGALGVGSATTPYWLKVYIDQPNHQWFGPFNFNVTCP